ncbi:MAG TPA: indole-3-glycerol phosphate synthase TrpC [Longimicrobiales bacterium]
MTVLDSIVAARRLHAQALAPRRAALRAAAEAAPPARAFASTLMAGPRISLVAEVKRRSPSAGWIRRDADAVAVAAAYEAAGAAAISVLTEEEHFGGSLADLTAVRAAVRVPVLRKDFIVDPVQLWEARAAGADAALLIVRVLDDAELADLLAAARDCGLGVLVEIHGAGELERALRAGAEVIGVNARDLGTLRTDADVVLALAARVPEARVLVGESGIRSAEDVERLADAGVDAVLVGESLMRAADPGAAARALAGVARRALPAVEVKICGLCRPEDARAAVEAGADYVGVVLAPGGPRSQTVASAKAIFQAAAGARRVGVFVDASTEEAASAARALGLAVLQLHGSEPPEQVAALAAAGPWQVWKAVRPRRREDVAAAVDAYGGVAAALLLDGWHPTRAGGTGTTFPWDDVAPARGLVPRGVRLVVAGGLTADNVAAAVGRLAPDVVDVSSGVESRPGVKSAERVRDFVAAARSVVPGRAARRGAAAGQEA